MQRIKSLDLARGFTVLMIAPIHTVLIYSKPEVYGTVMGKVLGFIAEGPGAQLFMLLMGLYFSFQQQQTFRRILKRALLLLAAGYGLNIVKFVIPYWAGLLPQALLYDLQIDSGLHGAIQLFLLGDILHFASIALVVLFFVKRIRHFEYWSLMISIIIIFISPFCWDLQLNNPFINYILELAGGSPPRVFFPLLPWIVYPLLGLSAGYFIKKYGAQVFAWQRNMGFIFLIYGWLLKTFFFHQISPSFYRTYPADTCIHIGIVFITPYVWQWLYTHVTDNYFFRLISYMSENITQVYLIQWIVICWLIPVLGYQQLFYRASLIAIVLTSFATFSLSLFLNILVKNKNQ